jgi:hypothetical protein
MNSATLFSAGPLPRANQSYNCIFGGFVVKRICSQDNFRGIAEFSVFKFRPFPAKGL